MRHIHTPIVSRHLDSGNTNILRKPPDINSSEEILLASLVAQLRANKSPFLKSYLHTVDAKSHPSPLCPLCNTHNTHHLFNCSHKRTRCHPCTAGQMDGEAGWWTTSRKIKLPLPPPPLARVIGVGRQQQ